MKTKLLTVILVVVILAFAVCACDGVWGGDEQSPNPGYHYVPSGELNSGSISGNATFPSSGEEISGDQSKLYYTFILEFCQPTDKTEVSDGDSYPHSTIDGELIASWEIPMYGNTVYESVVEYFKDKSESFTFRLSQHRYYMFHEYVTESGEIYNLETVYIAADGEYANCANFQSVLGEDGVAGTDDDLKVLTLVYKGWLY